jgi:hypothetical protein
MILTGKIKVLGEKSVPVPLCPPQIPHGPTRNWTQASAVRCRRLTAWAMARPFFSNLSSIFLSKRSPLHGAIAYHSDSVQSCNIHTLFLQNSPCWVQRDNHLTHANEYWFSNTRDCESILILRFSGSRFFGKCNVATNGANRSPKAFQLILFDSNSNYHCDCFSLRLWNNFLPVPSSNSGTSNGVV